MINFFYRNIKSSGSFLFSSHAFLPVRGLPRAVGELPSHQLLVALQCKLGSHQEASVEVRKAAYFEQRGHRRQGWVLLLCVQLGLEFKNIRGTKTENGEKWEENRNWQRSFIYADQLENDQRLNVTILNTGIWLQAVILGLMRSPWPSFETL